MTDKKKNIAVVAMYAAILTFLTYFMSIYELENNMSDFSGHVYTYIPLLKGASGLDGWMAVPYFMWHLVVMAIEALTPVPIKAAAAFTCCIFAVFSFYVLYWMIENVVGHYQLNYSEAMKGFMAFALSIIQPAYMYWFDTSSQYLGQFSMNPMHNPTHMCVKPFSLLCFCFTYDILQKYYDEKHRGVFISVDKSMTKAYVGLSVTLLLSCMAKPTFAEMFIPAVGIFMLIEWIKRMIQKDSTAKDYFQKCLTMLLVSVPALSYILLQFLAYFIWGGSYGGGGSSLAITEWMQVWRMYSENVAVSILLGMGFPLLILALNGMYFIKNTMGRLALIGYVVGLLECALLGESGGKITHGDFLWPMMSGMTILWTAATLRFLVLEEKQRKTKPQQTLIHIAWFVFFMYVLFGVMYMYNILVL